MHETTSVSRGPQRRPRCRRAGVSLAAAGTVTLPTAGRSASLASSSPAPARSSSAPGNGCLYWTKGNWIGQAQLNGADVNQKFIAIAQPNGPDAVVAGSGHLSWANDYNIRR
jgi:hypothetical protein